MACGTPRSVDANGLHLAAWEWGAAVQPPALLLHSLAAHSHWWDWVAPLLAERFHLIALDFRGHGGSQHVDPPAYGFADYVADVLAVVDRLGWRAPLVVGHSLGAYIGASLAARHPARVRALVIADMLTAWSDEQATRAREQAARPRLEFRDRREAVARFRLLPPETRAPAEWVRHLGEAGVAERGPGVWTFAVDRRVFLHPPVDPWPFLPHVRCPALVVRGQESRVMDREGWQRVAQALRRGHAGELKNAHHHLILDDPPGFVALVTTWLAGADKEGTR